jgi:hypothetical protein
MQILDTHLKTDINYSLIVLISVDIKEQVKDVANLTNEQRRMKKN